MNPGPRTCARTGTGQRLGWLDVLRGLAALCVVFDHLSYHVLQPARWAVYQWFDPGEYGVFVFFLISGYIVPASLERKGSVRTFWVSRIFRLYPLYLLAVGLAVILWLTHFGSLRGEASHAATSVLSQLLMMSNVVAGQNLPNVVWSLSYEMIFYLLLTALFLARIHRADRGLPAPGLDASALPLRAAAGTRRGVRGHPARVVLGDLPAGRTAHAERRPPAGSPARCPVRSRPFPDPGAHR